VTIATIYFTIPPGESTDITFDNLSVVRGTSPNCSLGNTTVTNITGYTAPSVTISGYMEKQLEGADLPDVKVFAEDDGGDETKNAVSYSTTTGTFSVDVLPGNDYTVSFSKTGVLDCGGGVNAADVNLLQQHLTTVQPFTKAIEHVAADASNNGTISSFDIIKMQQVIMGTGTIVSWKFMSESEFNGLSLPGSPSGVPSFSETLTYNNLTSNQSGVVIYGVKRGDVNSMACSDLTGKRLDGNRKTNSLIIPKLQAKAGEILLLPVYASDFKDQITFALGLQFNPEFIELLDLQNGALPELSQKDYTLNLDRKGAFDLLWYTMEKEGHTVKADEPLFFIRLKATRDIKDLEALVRLRYQRLENRMFAADGEQFDLSLGFVKKPVRKNNPKADETRPVSFYPNPFTESFTLELQSHKAEIATIRLISIEGRLLRTFEREVVKGFNRISIENMEELPKGYMVYEIVIADEIIKGKILKQ
jgi:hypothetical protein